MNAKVENQSSQSDTLKWLVVAVLLVVAIIANAHFSSQPVALRLIGWLLLSSFLLFIIYNTERGKKTWSFIQEARTELRKVVWPSRQETVQTTLIVVAMVVIAGLFLWGIDSLLLWLVGLLAGQRV